MHVPLVTGIATFLSTEGGAGMLVSALSFCASRKSISLMNSERFNGQVAFSIISIAALVFTCWSGVAAFSSSLYCAYTLGTIVEGTFGSVVALSIKCAIVALGIYTVVSIFKYNINSVKQQSDQI